MKIKLMSDYDRFQNLIKIINSYSKQVAQNTITTRGLNMNNPGYVKNTVKFDTFINTSESGKK